MFTSLVVFFIVFQTLECKLYLTEVEDGIEDAHDYKRDMSKMFRADYPIGLTSKVKKEMTKGMDSILANR